MSTLSPAFTAKVDFTIGCWEWTGALNSKGYGCISVDGEVRLAHRFAYEAAFGPIAEAMEIDHLCRNIRCVRPSHLEPVTTEENNRRRWAAHTSCKRGHELTPENVRVHTRKNGRSTNECRECANARALRYRAA